MHYREWKKPTASGALALQALPNHQLTIHGAEGTTTDLRESFDPAFRQLLLYPADDARVLSSALLAEDKRPVELIVPDGTWGQAKRMAKRIPGLDAVEKVVLPAGSPTEWGLREEPKLDGLATFEAIARALGVLESEAVQLRLETLFRHMVSTVVGIRGVKPRIHQHESKLPPLEVLYQDEDIICVNKPSGAVVHRGWANDEEPVLQRLRDQVQRRVYPVHRLDRATSGVLLFGFSPNAVRPLANDFELCRVKKLYRGICRGNRAEIGLLDHPVKTEKGDSRVSAQTQFTLLEAIGGFGYYEMAPLTGRNHQLRRHCKHLLQPLVGDTRYGKGDVNRFFRSKFSFQRLALHCCQLKFKHPMSGIPLEVDAALPAEIENVLNQLRACDLDELNWREK